MAKSIKVNQKRRPGRPATGRDPVSAVRLPVALTAAVDKWAAHQATSRSEAIRRLVELGLTVKTKGSSLESVAPKQSHEMKQRAGELAGDAIDDMTDTTASRKDQASRKRRLIKGPEEFQNMRRDRPKRK